MEKEAEGSEVGTLIISLTRFIYNIYLQVAVVVDNIYYSRYPDKEEKKLFWKRNIWCRWFEVLEAQ